ncbi:MAG TPA: hypothetical protein VNO86_09555 [Candidatus Binatia bacterium]|nr:hypothetical protein [Candidatus Binatia bacterium]
MRSDARTIAVFLLSLALLMAACGARRSEPPSAEPSPPPSSTQPAPSRLASPPNSPTPATKNPFGVMLPTELVRRPGGIETARALGAVYYRPTSIFLDRWEGRCLECDAALGAGLALVLTARASGPGATAPPRDLDAYRRTLAEVLDRYRPAVLVVENEENSALFYAGTPAEYAAELEAACTVAHERGIPCANGGLVSSLVALLVYDDARRAGDAARAERIARSAFTPEERTQLDSARAQEQLRKGEALLASYRAAGADFVNFHWYIADPEILVEAVAFLRAQTGLPAVTNEVGQVTDDPEDTTAIMAGVVDAGLPIAIWFGLDGPKARGLVDRDGTVRPTGDAFRRFIADHFGPIGPGG